MALGAGEHVGIRDSGQFFFGYQFREQSQPGDVLSKNLQFFFLELPRLQKVWEKLETNTERWCYLFGNLNNFAKVPDNPAGFDAVFDLARTDELDGSDLKKYLTSMLDRYYVYSTTEYARREGYKKGAEERQNELIKSLLSLGTPVETLVQATGLTPEAIQALK